jgi:hypothetical protein
MLSNGRISYYICQDPYLVKVPPFWKGFGRQTIGNPTILGLCCVIAIISADRENPIQHLSIAG